MWRWSLLAKEKCWMIVEKEKWFSSIISVSDSIDWILYMCGYIYYYRSRNRSRPPPSNGDNYFPKSHVLLFFFEFAAMGICFGHIIAVKVVWSIMPAAAFIASNSFAAAYRESRLYARAHVIEMETKRAADWWKKKRLLVNLVFWLSVCLFWVLIYIL